jgi:phosphoglycerol transferase MdoB-like AlkP superfamily enzyme
MLKTLLNRFKTWLPTIYGLAGAFVIAAGWNWYHTAYRPHSRFVVISLLTWVGVYVGYRIFKWAYHFLTLKFNRHIFWQKEFSKFLDSLFFIFSLFFLIFFSRSQLLSVGMALFLLAILFHQTQKYLSGHPNAHQWKLVNKNIFTLVFFLFSLFSTFQYIAYRFANFDSFLKFYNIVIFRSFAMTMFWILGFVLATLFYWQIKSHFRYVFISIWGLLFLFIVFGWAINIGIMYFSGLYISPMMLGLVDGSSGVVLNWLTALVIACSLLTFTLFGLIFRQIIHGYRRSSFRQWVYYSLALIPVALFALFGLSSFQNTPEYIIAKSFYQFWRGENKTVDLNPIVQEKLERFGFHYNLDKFNLAHKETVFNSTTAKGVLPAKFAQTKPNIIIIFLESFSARLTSVYNPTGFPGLTPGLEQMAADAHTTVFKNYYNGSTPTMNGILSQLCSFLPPTGYTEVEDNKNLQRLRLLCLPDILKNNGYKSATYITAVNKQFENKNAIFSSMNTDGVYGQEELAKTISGKPLSWGYSDHQLFPAMWQMVKEKKQEPFLMMLSTIDSHPPFDLAKDMVPYGDGKNNVLNSFHTADDAFAKFWREFKQSKYYDNTIVVAVADHATFPGADIKKLFPQDANNLSFYDQNMFMVYTPGGNLPREVNTYSSSIDVAPTLLQILNINVPNSFEGHSIFDDRNKYPNLLGMHEFGLYINQTSTGKRDVRYEIPTDISCNESDYSVTSSEQFTLCEYLDFYKWKRQMFEQGRFWEE